MEAVEARTTFADAAVLGIRRIGMLATIRPRPERHDELALSRSRGHIAARTMWPLVAL